MSQPKKSIKTESDVFAEFYSDIMHTFNDDDANNVINSNQEYIQLLINQYIKYFTTQNNLLYVDKIKKAFDNNIKIQMKYMQKHCGTCLFPICLVIDDIWKSEFIQLVFNADEGFDIE